MEMTDDMLRKIAFYITELRARVSFLQQALIQIGADPEAMEKTMEETLAAPEFQQFCNEIFDDLKDNS